MLIARKKFDLRRSFEILARELQTSFNFFSGRMRNKALLRYTLFSPE
jgi:hypothetical protein